MKNELEEIINLERTANALDYYDRLGHQFDLSSKTLTNDKLELLFQKLSEAGQQVGYAYGLDTAAINSLETCANCVRPNPWLRQKVAEWRALTNP